MRWWNYHSAFIARFSSERARTTKIVGEISMYLEIVANVYASPQVPTTAAF
jgi:hypothetical protein